MLNQPLNKFVDKKFWPFKKLNPWALPVLLVLAFLGQQLSGFDTIGWSHGFNHPLEGWDHLVTMLAVGVWAAQMRGKAVWILPLSFVSVMSLGGLAGAAGLSIPSVEGIILLSCAVFSVLITRKIRFNTYINVLIVGFFAFFHGFAHGQEISTSASLMSYTLGFMFATLLLHGAGILAAKIVLMGFVGLLTFFSSTTQAKNLTSNAYNYTQFSIVNTHKIHGQEFGYRFNPLAVEYFTTQQNQALDLMGSRVTMTQPKIIGTSVAIPISDAKFAIAPAIDKSYVSGYSTDSNLQVLVQKNAQFQILHVTPWLWLNNQFDTVLGLVEFNHYYPNINNSPGTSLLSNGVGVTSPPLPSDLSACLNTQYPYPLIEALLLQLTVSKLQLTKPLSTISDPYHTHSGRGPWFPAQPNLNSLVAKQSLIFSHLKQLTHDAEITSPQPPISAQNCLLIATAPINALSIHDTLKLHNRTFAIEKPPPNLNHV